MIKVRIAPSPTGDPHVGTGYSALFNWVFARKNKGALILRIEDTDRKRSTPESEKAIMEALEWLGIRWDEGPVKGGPNGPYRQSEREMIYREHVKTLVDAGAAYPCFCPPERLAEVRAAQKAAKASIMGYDGHCRGLDKAEAEESIKKGIPHVIRLKVNKEETTHFDDLIRGGIRMENVNIDDQVLVKSDGFPTYHLANVVDDHLMGVTHVIRAEEWITSTPKHVILYNAFGWKMPVFAHLSLLRNKDRSKISKRKNPTSLLYYKNKGYLPEALLNFFSLMGWATSDEEEVFSTDRMIKELKLEDLHIGGPVFDLDKLHRLNGAHIRAKHSEELADRDSDGFLGGREVSREMVLKLLPLVQERMKTLSDFSVLTDYFFGQVSPSIDDFKKAKKMSLQQVSEALDRCAERIEAENRIDAEETEQVIRSLAIEMNVKPGSVFMALRIAVTGRVVSPPLLESMAILGTEECLKRVRAAAQATRES